jgi:hypothetical protein
LSWLPFPFGYSPLSPAPDMPLKAERTFVGMIVLEFLSMLSHNEHRVVRLLFAAETGFARDGTHLKW